jgi:hypothetical protein
MLSVIMLSVIMLSVIMLSVIMLSVIMLSVMAPIVVFEKLSRYCHQMESCFEQKLSGKKKKSFLCSTLLGYLM